MKEYRIIPREELIRKTKTDLARKKRRCTAEYNAYRGAIIQRQQAGQWRRSKPNGVKA